MTTQKSDETQADKPKSSPARKLVLLLLLVATIIVVGLDYLPESDSETEVVGPTKKARPATRAPAQPQGQQPATPQRTAPQQQKKSPAPAPTPPRYERPSTTVFVSGSPSDAPVSAPTPAETAAAQAATVPKPETTPSVEIPTEPAVADPAPAETATKETPPPAAESVPATPAPVAEAVAVTEAPPESAAAEAAAPTPTVEAVATTEAPAAPESPAELVAARSLAPSSTPEQDNSELVVVVGQAESSLQAAARPLPKGPVPAKVERYARRLFDRYDTNRDGVIDATERRQMQGNPTMIDYNADGEISREELAAYTANFGRHRRMRLTGTMVEEAVADLPPLYIPTAEREAMAAAQAAAQQTAQQAQAVPVALVDETGQPADDTVTGSPAVEEDDEPEQPQPAANSTSSKRFVTPRSRQAGLPKWFLAQDDNGDGQITVAEYAPSSEETRLADFARFDRNKDGVLTAQECPK